MSASHYVKMMLDMIFGVENFRNEIIWLRTSNTGSLKIYGNYFGKNHDCIMWYSKTSSYVSNISDVSPKFTDDDLKRFSNDDNDGRGPYYWNTLTHINQYEKLKQDGKAKWPEGLKYPKYKQYLNETKKVKILGDVWTDIKFSPLSKERLDYPTQKPEELLERIILVSSNKIKVEIQPISQEDFKKKARLVFNEPFDGEEGL